ncbi:MAG: ClpXP protease specificity-enhancing factor [Betaproteobacteria bacterium]|jgi:stringent starvation protein B|nr:ClpXP protease specificity-enhancing factor [Betaproteobacteria bacterium]NBT09421.1 ClpXP protease specificity-enhancing factor [Betaproteobacteria bacterium]NBU49066.1 ClpXP protease specificity-enhancing factor [Betaproteobacteria bacterium]NBX96533.1 ClpXP protease specificity-enhancing factor [Betaproteobacteria bacterium]
MSNPLSPESQGNSTRPYLIRALHDWCADNGFTPYLAVHVDETVDVPREYVKNNEIVLNVGFEATSGLQLGNEFIEFKARFGGVAREICVPVDHVVAIYARENGQGMAFPMPVTPGSAPSMGSDGSESASAVGGASPARPGAPRLAAVPSHRMVAADEAGRGSLGGHAHEDDDPDPSGPDAPGGRPSLKRIK